MATRATLLSTTSVRCVSPAAAALRGGAAPLGSWCSLLGLDGCAEMAYGAAGVVSVALSVSRSGYALEAAPIKHGHFPIKHEHFKSNTGANAGALESDTGALAVLSA